MPTKLNFIDRYSPGDGDGSSASMVIFVGTQNALLSPPVRAMLPHNISHSGQERGVDEGMWERLVQHASSTASAECGGSTQTWLPLNNNTSCSRENRISRVAVCVVPEECSRHNCASRPDVVTELLRRNVDAKENALVVFALQRVEDALGYACATARAFPVYSHKSVRQPDRDVFINFCVVSGVGCVDKDKLAAAAEATRLAVRLVDTPTSELNTDMFVEEVRVICKEIDVEPLVIQGEELERRGFGGLWNVGKASVHKPALVVLSYRPGEKQLKTQQPSNVVWVGKGIVYDTGGLAIKSKDGMVGMKRDMGGAAAVFAAFVAAVKWGYNKGSLHAILCLAENSVGPDSLRNDDIITLYSGKTVEINNTDAEGRLVLGDGVAYATKELGPVDVLLDMATLTGAQGPATGKRHAAIICNNDEIEQDLVRAGRVCGDLVHPLLYCPEFLKKEFASQIADMKNSVKDRSNATSSCAAQFVANHISDSFTGKWVHADIAATVYDSSERGTGYGVALLLQAFVSQPN